MVEKPNIFPSRISFEIPSVSSVQLQGKEIDVVFSTLYPNFCKAIENRTSGESTWSFFTIYVIYEVICEVPHIFTFDFLKFKI